MKGSSDDVRGSVAAIGDSAVHAAAGRGDDIHSSSGVEGLAPITAELRRYMEAYKPTVDGEHVEIARIGTIGYGGFVEHCDAIDAVHAQLERENAELRERVAELDKRGESMHDGRRITDELRAWWVRKFPVMDKKLHEDFTAIADRIDAENESACAEAYGNGVMSVPIALDESQWVKLPVDADGETIHIGDVMENIVCPSVHREVTGVGAECFYGWDDGNGRYSQFDVNCYRHYHAPTVEDVLTKFGIDWEYKDNCEDRAALLAEYAAKLRLAEGEDA